MLKMKSRMGHKPIILNLSNHSSKEISNMLGPFLNFLIKKFRKVFQYTKACGLPAEYKVTKL